MEVTRKCHDNLKEEIMEQLKVLVHELYEGSGTSTPYGKCFLITFDMWRDPENDVRTQSNTAANTARNIQFFLRIGLLPCFHIVITVAMTERTSRSQFLLAQCRSERIVGPSCAYPSKMSLLSLRSVYHMIWILTRNRHHTYCL